MVQYIKYNKKKYPILLGNYSLAVFQQEQGAVLSDLKENVRLYEPLLFYALKQGAKFEHQELDLTEDDMVFVLDQCLVQFIQSFPKFFPEQIPEELQQQLGKLEEEGGTKKRTGTKSAAKR